MMTKKRLSALLFDSMGVLFACCLIVLALTGVWTQRDIPVYSALAPNSARVIVVDAGHGGPDGGAKSADNVVEAGLNLQVAKLVESGLKEAGFEVIMTRTDENALGSDKKNDMAARREIMRKENVAAVVSIHMNKWRDISVSGPMAFYMKGSSEGEALATNVIAAVCDSIGRTRRPSNPGDYFVLRESISPAVIVECGFLSNPGDVALLQDSEHQSKLAKGIVAGISAYFSSQPSPAADNTAAPTATPTA